MWLFYLIFLLLITILTIRIIIVLWTDIWSATEATILDYQIKTRTFECKFPSLQEDVVKKYLKVNYEYFVNGKRYESKRVSLDFGDKIYREEEFKADNLIKSIMSNKVKAEYLSSFPQLSVLIRSKNDTAGSLCIIFILLVFMSIFYVVLASK